MDEVKYLYRYEAQRYSVVIDAEMEIYGSTAPKLKLRKYPISHITPKGKWIGWNGGKWRWVNDTSRKRYAHDTKESLFRSIQGQVRYRFLCGPF